MSRRVLYLRPVGPVDPAVPEWLKAEIGRALHARTEVMRPMALPEGSLDPRRGQYHSTKILGELLAEVPDDASKVQGIVDRDLCIPILTFVFGEAQLSGTVSVVSTVRLRQEFHGLPPDRRLFLARLRKESLHELGHTFGLIHCRDRGCLMYLSNTIMDVDLKGDAFCRHCRTIVRAHIDAGR